MERHDPMETIKRIRERSKETVDGTNTQDKYKCSLCRDTSWVQGNGGLKRCECYKLELIQRKWSKFGVNPNDVKPINAYEVNSPIRQKAKHLATEYVRGFKELDQRVKGIAFLGQPGAGKTHLALGVGKALIEREKADVLYMPYLEVMRELKANAREEEAYNKVQAKYINCGVLIIDDMFKDKVKGGRIKGELTETDVKHIYPIINQRYINHRATVFSSECDPYMLEELDNAIGWRILEMCGSNLVIFKYCEENNYRSTGGK